jgi:tripartite ATP-independent transporter DctP family solute receptor
LGAAVAVPSILSRTTQAAEFTYKYASNVNADHPLTKGVVEAAERILQATSGRIDLQIFPNSQLGSELDMLIQLRTGAIDFYSISGIVLGALTPVAAIQGVGFAFADYQQVWRALDGELGAHIRASIAKAGVIAFDRIWNGGFRQITASKRQIHSPADLRGFKIRVPVSALWTKLFLAFGAAPAGINFAEVYSALRTRIVDGQETSLIGIEAARLYEVQKYCATTDHMWDGFWFLANPSAWRRLPEDLRDTVSDIVNQTALEQRAEVENLSGALRGRLASQGLIFNEVDRAEFADTLRNAGVYAEWKAKFGTEAWSLLEQSIGRNLA